MYIVRVYICLVFRLAGCGSCARPGAGPGAAFPCSPDYSRSNHLRLLSQGVDCRRRRGEGKPLPPLSITP